MSYTVDKATVLKATNPRGFLRFLIRRSQVFRAPCNDKMVMTSSAWQNVKKTVRTV